MSFKENLRAKIQLDRVVQKLASTMRETPGQLYLDKKRMRELLRITDLEHMKVRDLDLYVRPLDGEIKEVLVLDNELPIYHTTVADVALRKSPEWKEMISIKNIKKILNDRDVIASKGKDSLKRVHANALALLDLSYTEEDITALMADARLGLEQKSLAQIQESFDLFFELLGFQAIGLEVLEENIHVFARPKVNSSAAQLYEDLILFDVENLWVRLKKGSFSPQSDLDLFRVIQCANDEEPADLQGAEVFVFLAELILKK